MVCIGSSGSQVSIQSKSGSKVPPCVNVVVIAKLLRLVLLLCLEKVSILAGSFPLAFSDNPRSCSGTASSTDSAIDGARECVDAAIDFVSVSSSESSSSPMAKVPPSSGTSLNDGGLLVGLLSISIEGALADAGLRILASSVISLRNAAIRSNSD